MSDVDASDAGPGSFEEIMAWGRKLLCSALAMLAGAGVGTKAVLQKLSSTDVVITTSYSGIGVAETSLPFLQDALAAHGCDLKYTLYGATDIDPLCRRMLLEHHERSQSQHVFGDLLERVPQYAVDVLRKMQQNYRAKLDSHVAASAKCPAQEKRAAISKYGRAFVTAGLAYLEKFPLTRTSTCFCHKHSQQCLLWPSAEADCLHVEIGGNTCTPWSSAGKQLGWLDAVSIPCIVWLHSVRQANPSIVINECTPSFDADVLLRLMHGTHHYVSNVFGPSLMGIPCNRDRRYTVLIRKDCCEHLNLLGHEDFHQLMFAKVVASPRIFLRASDRLVASFINGLAEQRGLAPPADGSSFCAKLVLSPWLKLQLSKYLEYLAGSERFSGNCNVFVDLSQDAGQRPRAHELIPCLLRNSFLWSIQAKRPLHPLEIFAVQCLPVLLPPGSNFADFSPWSDEFLETLSRSQAQHLAGNSMVLPAIGGVLLLALLNACGKANPSDPSPGP